MNDSIVGKLFDKKFTIAIAAVLVALLTIMNTPVFAADKAKTKAPASTTTADKAKTKAPTTPVTDDAKSKAAATTATDTVKTDNAGAGDKSLDSTKRGAGISADTAADGEGKKPLTEKEAQREALREAMEAQRESTAKNLEEFKKQGWIIGPVKTKEELPPFKMVYVKGGCFEMGDWTGDGSEDERPVHTVCVSNYYISETEVTQKLWDAVTGTIPSIYADPDKPVTNIKPRRLARFLTDLNKLTGKFYRLPTEAEWEYAGRSRGNKQLWAGTDNEDDLSDYAWFSDNSDNMPQKVKQKKPNALGLYDMTGNVWEIVEDYFDFQYYERSPKRDPLNAEFTTWYTIRGGSYTDGANSMRVTYRLGIEKIKTAIDANVGFRIAE